ncbi:protein EXECUTER 2 chloroplastic [Tripterygium wilfordii]|uniref:Protein EXECUTER 2 chloroplastic n=1 Tax=Tripterygium wilfordii TaxID=458696 RepID=A0A7J7CL09_TRIWF|nr:protein EXECUTER 2, chloroplastic isoform X2 [Tripterygium wilfordii]KAF5734752.1 protein EXECUTER 2 chloroplastic [Tripterygium wilfordii]
MIGVNAWGITQAASLPQLRPFCCIDFLANKPNNLNFVLGLGCSLPSLSPNKTRRNPSLGCLCSGNQSTPETTTSSSCLDWDWNRWTRHFSEIEQAESFTSVLRFQLEDAIEKEDFQEAGKLKTAITEANSNDSVAEIMCQLKSAIDEERYHDASKLCKHTGSGLVGWWVGYSKDTDDPFGTLVRITPGMGRFVGRSYSPRQLVTASPGTPLFEIFVVKDSDETYVMQVVYLQQVKGRSTSSISSKSTKSPSTPEAENASVVDVQESGVKAESDEKGIHIEEATEEGIKSVINFLKDKIPGLKLKVMNINVTEDVLEDNDSMKQLLQEGDETTVSDEDSNDEPINLEDVQPDGIDLEEVSHASEDGKDLDTKLFIGGVVHNTDDSPSKEEYTRVPAEIRNMERESFILHVPKRSLESDNIESKASRVKVAAIAAQGVSELMPPEVAKAFWGADKVSSKVSKNVREIVKLAVSQAQKRNRLSENTTFSRIMTSDGNLDPFDGLYVGAFGPYGTEIVQLRRKFGHWNGVEDASSDVEFFEYVEAVKLTGDLNVPAGEVTFRAKIGKGSRNSNRGMYPDELGVAN